MSGLELAAAVLALLEAVISTVKSLHGAYKQNKHLPHVCKRLQDKLLSIRDIVRIVKDEQVLCTPKVVGQLRKLERRGKQIKLLLRSIHPTGKSTARLFLHQLFRGLEDEQRLAEIISDLEGDKTSLIVAIQVVGVGLRKDHELDITYVTTASAKRIDDILREKLNLHDGLRIMRVIDDRGSDGKVPLTDEDLVSLSACMEPTIEGKKPATERIILNNVARFQATQINAPLGEDIWANVDRLVVENNQADALSTQINYPMTLGAFYSGFMPQLAFWTFLCFFVYLLLT
ncbi:hypothetical protein BHE90_015091 [Fusarium euwallaceae]|uniref:Fungal N-terminal domain-containing protein n=1 Tax=Fusarium euwallaceae TaxID=1147111 RepID=A0A430L476_9HYPO|nr:hypothetical protein BHE90_015091 [Fusarium euwallaceae]